MKIKIWYMNKKGWERFGSKMVCEPSKPGSPPPDRPTLDNLEETHVHLMTLDLNDIPQQNPKHRSLDDVFAWMQGENWSPNGEARSLIEKKGLSHTSMSVGDVMAYGDEIYIVAPLGFQLIQ